MCIRTTWSSDEIGSLVQTAQSTCGVSATKQNVTTPGDIFIQRLKVGVSVEKNWEIFPLLILWHLTKMINLQGACQREIYKQHFMYACICICLKLLTPFFIHYSLHSECHTEKGKRENECYPNTAAVCLKLQMSWKTKIGRNPIWLFTLKHISIQNKDFTAQQHIWMWFGSR